MLAEVFYWVFNMSITGILTGIVIIILRQFRRIPRTICHILWALPFLRLVLPFGLSHKYSIMNLLNRLSTRTRIIHITPSGSAFNVSLTNQLALAKSYFPTIFKTNLLENIFNVASIIWIIIAISALLTIGTLYFITKSEVKTAVLLKDNIYISDKLLSPAVFGIFRPRIILPEYISDKNNEFVLLHEQTHLKRGDNLFRIIAIIICCFHWFNPFIWLFLKLFLEDMELSCDELVLKKCGTARKKEYAAALIECEENKMLFASAFGGAKIKVRIKNILSYKKLTLFSGLFFLALIIIITVTRLTNAVV